MTSESKPPFGLALLAADLLALEVERLLIEGGGNATLREALGAYDNVRVQLRGDHDPQRMTIADWPASDEPVPPTRPSGREPC